MKGLPISEEQIQALLRLGESQLELGQMRQAARSFENLLKAVPAHAEALYGLAKVARAQGKKRQQLAYLKELLSVHPHHLAAVMDFAALAPEASLFYLERALEGYPQESALLLQLARSLHELGQFERARFYLEQLLSFVSHGPQAGEAWLRLAQLSLRQGELNLATRAFEAALQADPEIRHDPRWINLNTRWQQLEAKAGELDWQLLEKRLGSNPGSN